MIEIKNLSHSFYVGKKGKEREIPVLNGISLEISQGEIASIFGKSGSGKSTLLNLISGFMKPGSGRILINGEDVTSFSEKQWAAFRLQNFGFIFQNFQLIPSLSTFDNVALPLVLEGVHASQRKLRVQEILQRVGLLEQANHFPNELSGGQQQRVSIARALILNPQIILADEPTGSLDSETEKEILNLIRELNRQQGITFFIITHDEEVAEISDKRFYLHDGALVNGGVSIEV
ncbi:ATP-binding cassette domain-containing protein [Bacillus mangrovi]|uniref:ATP-binding cassette domain-containing protein n=1 Tax=Metabacillus mangrovi TaxID=1491830 RepID=A0A7X2S739_9BACI|nr:ABC transporter ATP-binding protein [Metabacillus mangrovi]MTH54490.1 ATP-binding cassette domain-containing protein [Metabacillus mangrovi]